MGAGERVKRAIPDLVENLETCAPGISRPQRRKVRIICCRGAVPRGGVTGETSELLQGCADVVEAALLRSDETQPKGFELLLLAHRGPAFPIDDEIGPHRQQPLDVDGEDIGDPRDVFCTPRIVAEGIDADDPAPRSHGEQQLGDMRAQAHDARRGHGR